jgi:hypothetical protein
LRQFELGSQHAFAASHLAVVDLVVVAGEVQQPVQNEDFDFRRERMTLLGCLAERRGHADGKVAGEAFGSQAFSGKRQDVGGLVLTAKTTIESANGFISGEQDCDLSAETHCSLRGGEEAR